MAVIDARRSGDRRASRVPTRRVLAEVALIVVLLAIGLTVDPSGSAGPGGLVQRDDRTTTVALVGRIEVPRGPVHGDVWVLRGDVRIHGIVDGDVTVWSGSVRVLGEVTGNVTVARGSVEVADGGRVGGEARRRLDLLDLPPSLELPVWSGVWLLALVGMLACRDRPSRRRSSNGPGTALAVGGALGSAILLSGVVGPASPVVLVFGAVVIAQGLSRVLDPGHPPVLRSWLLAAGALQLVELASPPLAVALLCAGAAQGLGDGILALDRRVRRADA